MIFPMGSIFIFGSWVCEADDEGNLERCLIEAQEACEEFTLLVGSTKDLTERFFGLIVSESTRAPMIIRTNSMFGSDSSSGSNPGSIRGKLSSFPIGLRNAA
jgi:hypothetical protein